LFMNADGTLPEWDSGVAITAHTFDMTTASGNQTLAGAGFTPSAALILTGTDGVVFTAGVSNGTIHHSLFYTTTYPNSASYNSTQVISIFTGADDRQNATLTFNADGGVLSWVKTNNPSGTLQIIVLWLR